MTASLPASLVARARRNMVENQLRANQILWTPLLDAMGAVPREVFVPAPRRSTAYTDATIPLAEGRQLLPALAFAKLVEALRPQPDDLILDVGCASGYSTAVLTRLASDGAVVALESDADLSTAAEKNLAGLGAVNAAIIQAPLSEGYAKEGPYDVILVNGAATRAALAPLLAQLKEEGGRLAAILTPDDAQKPDTPRAHAFLRAGKHLSSRILFDAPGVADAPLPGLYTPAGFVFAGAPGAASQNAL